MWFSVVCTHVFSTTIRVITAVKMLWTHEAQPSESTTNFDHCDEKRKQNGTK